MNTFQDSISTKPKPISWISIVLVALLLALLLWVTYQFKGEQRFAFVKLFDKGHIISFSENYSSVELPSDKKYYGVIIAEKGACMGSGWLLLLVPTVFLFSLVFPRKLLKKSFKKEKK
ncbi:hypothetical protein ACM55G_09795 [Flavobacterium sp. LB3P122]|uniref:hypothetical protein n=1 Tax=Flavobacterium algoriphilum TaxID=3398738 RepID=UPI003A8B7AB2